MRLGVVQDVCPEEREGLPSSSQDRQVDGVTPREDEGFDPVRVGRVREEVFSEGRGDCGGDVGGEDSGGGRGEERGGEEGGQGEAGAEF